MKKIFNFNEYPIKKKIIFITVFISFIVLFISSTSFFAVQYTTTESNKKDQVSSITSLIARNITAALVFSDLDAANEMLLSLENSPTIKQALVLDQNNIVFAELNPGGPKFDLNKLVNSEKSVYKDSNLLIVSEPVMLDGKKVGTVIIADNLQDLNYQLLTYLVVAVVVFLASLMVALILSSELQQIITKSISQLTEIAEKVTRQENYSIRAIKDSNDEMGELIENFNNMLEQLQTQKREIDDLRRKVDKK